MARARNHRQGLDLSGSKSCALQVLFELLGGHIGEHNPLWQEFGLTQFEVVASKIRNNDSDGPCGLEPMNWIERDFDVYVKNEHIASISVWNCGSSTPFSGWYPESIRYRAINFDHPDKVLERVGQDGWHRKLSPRVTRSDVPTSAYLGDWERIDFHEVETLRKERVA